MNFLARERRTLTSLLPTLAAELRGKPVLAVEEDGNTITQYRRSSGPALLIPQALGGLGVTPVQAIQIHCAIAAHAPSLAIAITMHNFSVATLVEYTLYGDHTQSVLKNIARENLLVASGFAEGRTGANILVPYMEATKCGQGYVINGSKKPCSLSRSMDLLTASVMVKDGLAPQGRRAVAIIPASMPGISTKKFWKSWVLASAESDEILLENVFVPDECIFYPEHNEALDAVETGGLLWFELLISASYIGIASALVEQVFHLNRGNVYEHVLIASELEAAMAALESVGYTMLSEPRTESLLVRCLLIRYSVQESLHRVASKAAELLGGLAFIGGNDVSYLLSASRALAFHPPSKNSVAGAISAYLRGGAFEMVS
jgi:alkylation response protein AidB-like acyl-CoA dehydrogenase